MAMPNRILLCLPSELKAVLPQAAAREFTTVSEFLRRAAVDRIRAVGVTIPPPEGHNDNRDTATCDAHGSDNDSGGGMW
jgi:hypothetical protein